METEFSKPVQNYLQVRRWTIGLLVAVAMSSCQTQANQPVAPSSAVQSATTDCRAVIHEMGETEICGTPQRIVGLGPYVLEPLLTLEAQPIAYADHIAFHQGDYTDPGQQIPYLGSQITQPIANVGLAYTPSIEALAKVNPDLILGTKLMNAEQYETLSKLAPTVMVEYDHTEKSLKTIAHTLNRPEQANQLLAQTAEQVDAAQKAFATLVKTHPKVALLSASEALEITVSYDGGLCRSLVETLGFQLVFPSGLDQGNSNTSVPISLEALPQFNDADLVILLGHNFSDLKQFEGMDRFEEQQLSKLKQAWEENEIAQSLNASKAGRVYFIPTYLCAGLPGTIGTELYLEELKQQLLTSGG
ncbi:MAG: iron-siderophore ABC transporter substrate-binding protein [Cyanobacteria bacterium P01_F01_bin.116]